MGDDETGGYTGSASSTPIMTAVWSSGAVVSGNGKAGGFAAPASADTSFRGANSSYWNLDTSGVPESDESRGIGAVMQALTDSDFGGEAEAAAWSFGDIDLSDGDGDFPFLKSSSQPWQAVNLARVLARPLGVVAGLEPIAAVAGATLTATRIRLDTNGLAADINSIRTSTPTCAFDSVSRVLQAETNYNNVAIEMTLLADGGEKLIAASDCEVAFEDATNGEFAATLRLIISAPEIGDDEARVLTKDYPLHIDPDPTPTPDPLAEARAARAAFVAAHCGGRFRLVFGGKDCRDWRQGERLGRRRRCESLRLDSDFGSHCRRRPSYRGQFDIWTAKTARRAIRGRFTMCGNCKRSTA